MKTIIVLVISVLFCSNLKGQEYECSIDSNRNISFLLYDGDSVHGFFLGNDSLGAGYYIKGDTAYLDSIFEVPQGNSIWNNEPKIYYNKKMINDSIIFLSSPFIYPIILLE